ncbi:aminotransferase class V-fold PLP-dependent enzyme [Kineobactrum salinum]|uniref:Aminotransferase class V-fold PLP-dependent enzyme n=1 Tax=Kineobactrum salinum TaxID=2708301 RepID=A0A6C0U3U9_9GAMM|nr:aminotransferase class V-fold PLP-dependent enzyme [Kineobactrum salinum]QIB66706.1 aminotransferase class V-fold PLP-dependent enzyme [Kineobactrum salinum]
MSSLIARIRDGIIGQHQPITTPFGSPPLVYADYTASGRSLGFIEDYIREQVLPWYANTHTESSYTGAHTTALRESARATVRRAVNGGADDKVIFCGSGATAAINKLIDILKLRQPLPEAERPVVFIGPYEHHSNELPWRESSAELEVIPLDRAGGIDQQALAQALARHRDRALLIGSFSAASNVTGIKSDVAGITALLKRHGALAFWDYAAAGPYVAIDMNGADPLDAVFLSPHKFVGGPGTPGLLIAKSALFRNRVPAMVGGGTVTWVSPEDHLYISDIERREEGGTPAIVESIRAGLAFSLQQEVGTAEIQRREEELAAKAMQRLRDCAGIEVLGSLEATRLPIFSLRFHYGSRELHYGYVVALLNDLFGIQVRGGCSCAGPYAHSLLGMSRDYSKRLEAAIAGGASLLRPGWVRLNFNYFIADAEFEYLLSALELVAEHGWRLLPCYRYDSDHGVWRYQDDPGCERDPLASLCWGTRSNSPSCPVAAPDFAHCLTLARTELLRQRQTECCAPPKLAPAHEALRWFALARDLPALDAADQA